MDKSEFDDAAKFGIDVIVYCASHMRPHFTGWCTVPNSQKTKLAATNITDAVCECRDHGYPIYGETENTRNT